MCIRHPVKENLPNLHLGIRQAKSTGEESGLMRKLALTGILVLAAAIARAEPILPTAPGTTWRYDSTEELGGPAAAAPTAVAVTVKVGRQLFEGREFLKFETTTDDVVTRTDLMTVDD